jgi:hypothetical protein
MGRIIVNVKLEGLCEEATVAYFKISKLLPGDGTKTTNTSDEIAGLQAEIRNRYLSIQNRNAHSTNNSVKFGTSSALEKIEL